MSDELLKAQLIKISAELYTKGLLTPSGGNISVRSEEFEDSAWITPSGIFKGDLSVDDLVLIDLDGKKLAGKFNPSVEAVYHGPVMKLRKEINAVVHTHAPMSTVFACSDLVIPPFCIESLIYGFMPKIPWFFPGSKELVESVCDNIGKPNVKGAFLRKHGLVTVGNDLRQAADATIETEHLITMFLQMKACGIEPEAFDKITLEKFFKYTIK